MPELLTPASTVKKVRSNIEKFETLSLSENDSRKDQGPGIKKSPFLIIEENAVPVDEALILVQEVKRVKVSEPTDAQLQESTQSSAPKQHEKIDATAFLQRTYLQGSSTSLVDDALQILQSKPSRDQLDAVLEYLRYGTEGKHGFNVRYPNPQAAQILNTLVNITVPDYWQVLKTVAPSSTDKKTTRNLRACFSSVAGIGALLARLKELTVSKAHQSQSAAVEDILSFVSRILQTSNVLQTFLDDACKRPNKVQGRLYWQETIALLGGSRILSTVSTVAKPTLSTALDGAWLGDSLLYSEWLARAMSSALINIEPTSVESFSMLAQLLKRSLSLGHRAAFTSTIYHTLLLGQKALWTPMQSLLHQMLPTDQKTFFDSILLDATQKYSNNVLDSSTTEATSNRVSALAALVAGLIKNNVVLEDHLTHWLVPTSGVTANLSLQGRRALLVNIAHSQGKLKTVLEKALLNFGDKLQIQHSPIVAQQSLTQTVIMTAGYLRRLSLSAMREMTRTSLLLLAVSNRLAASVPQARLLGMIAGTVLSRMVDEPLTTMKFDLDGYEEEELSKYLALATLTDAIGDVGSLRRDTHNATDRILVARIKPSPRTSTNGVGTANTKALAIEEVADAELDELVPHAKPDEDPSDSDDDPTMIDRNKPTAPVYITDLVKYLGSNDNLDLIDLALKTAPSLIRRKAGFGTELSSNAIALAASLINLKEGDHQMRLESLIACLVSSPSVVGPYLSALYFDGDFSLVQRATLLSTIGLGTRELAGYTGNTTIESSASTAFPSSKLPPHLAAIYAPISEVARSIEHSALQPLALAAADKVTGPDILKVRTFSSRLDVEKRNAQRVSERSKRIPKDLHRLLTDCFYLPLCCRMSLALSSHHTPYHTIFEPHILRLFLQTLVVILSSLGPHAIQLPTVTHETLLLLTALHNMSNLSYDPVILPALLQLLLTTLDLNIEAGRAAEERLVTDFGPMLAELIAWAANIENVVAVPVAAGESMQGMPWNVILAGIQVKWHEVGRKFQGRMLGLTMGEMDML